VREGERSNRTRETHRAARLVAKIYRRCALGHVAFQLVEFEPDQNITEAQP
jgi:hypothetical protein